MPFKYLYLIDLYTRHSYIIEEWFGLVFDSMRAFILIKKKNDKLMISITKLGIYTSFDLFSSIHIDPQHAICPLDLKSINLSPAVIVRTEAANLPSYLKPKRASDAYHVIIHTSSHNGRSMDFGWCFIKIYYICDILCSANHFHE